MQCACTGSGRESPDFALEFRALRHVHERLGFQNVVIMMPFCRTPFEADKELEVMAENGLERGREGLEPYVMAELPTDLIEAEAFAEHFDGFSIGSNDLTQLTLGISRDAEKLTPLFDESEASVTWLIRQLIEKEHEAGRPVGLWGEAPSNHPGFAAFLVEAGTDSILLATDSVLGAVERVAELEAHPVDEREELGGVKGW